MPVWADYKKQAEERGSLACEMFAVISTPVEPPEKLREVLPDHLKYQSELEKEGKLVMAGPLSDLSGTQMEGVGLIIYRASTLEQATQMANMDPMHSSGTRSYTIQRWLVNEGSFQIDIKFAAQRVSI
ncbi:MAG: hypothetical protein KTR35_21800 [Gammaproteobacteria bacterium]|nr:hypothetical protein [Gammaproteobacteria bacterium]